MEIRTIYGQIAWSLFYNIISKRQGLTKVLSKLIREEYKRGKYKGSSYLSRFFIMQSTFSFLLLALMACSLYGNTLVDPEQNRSYKCPEMNVNLRDHDLDQIHYVSSWNNCGKFIHKTCLLLNLTLVNQTNKTFLNCT